MTRKRDLPPVDRKRAIVWSPRVWYFARNILDSDDEEEENLDRRRRRRERLEKEAGGIAPLFRTTQSLKRYGGVFIPLGQFVQDSVKRLERKVAKRFERRMIAEAFSESSWLRYSDFSSDFSSASSSASSSESE